MVTSSQTSNEDTLLSLSELVDATGVPASTIHHYLKCELIPPPTRSALNRFRYDQRHVTNLLLIRTLRERKGMGLDEIAAQLPALLDQPDALASLGDPREREEDAAGRIVDAAISAFRTRSFGEVTMADVADSAGVAKGSIYRYFASKDDLFTAAIERVLDRTAEGFAAAVERLGGAAAVAEMSAQTAEEFAAVAADAMPMLLELGTRAAKGNLVDDELARRVLRTLAEAIGRPLLTGPEDPPAISPADKTGTPAGSGATRTAAGQSSTAAGGQSGTAAGQSSTAAGGQSGTAAGGGGPTRTAPAAGLTSPVPTGDATRTAAVEAGLAVIQQAFSVLLQWAVGTDWPPDAIGEAQA